MAARFDESISKIVNYMKENPSFFSGQDTIRKIYDTLKTRNPNLLDDLKSSFDAEVYSSRQRQGLLEWLESKVGSQIDPATDTLVGVAKQLTPKPPPPPPTETSQPFAISNSDLTERFYQQQGIPVVGGRIETPESIIDKLVDVGVRNDWIKPNQIESAKAYVRNKVGVGEIKGVPAEGVLSSSFTNFIKTREGELSNIGNFAKNPRGILESVASKISGDATKFEDLDDETLSLYQSVLTDIGGAGIDTKISGDAITGILSGRGQVTQRRGEVAALEAEIPGLLESQRRAFFGEQRQQARDYLTGQVAPQIYQGLARRGLADSGEFGATVGAEFQSLMSEIEQQELAKESEDINFWANQSYQNTLEDLIQAKQSVSQQIGEIREDVISKQQQSFTKAQTNIQQRFALDLFRRENERALQTYQRQLAQRESQQRRQREAGLISDIFQAGATGIGLALTRGKTGVGGTGGGGTAIR